MIPTEPIRTDDFRPQFVRVVSVQGSAPGKTFTYTVRFMGPDHYGGASGVVPSTRPSPVLYDLQAAPVGQMGFAWISGGIWIYWIHENPDPTSCPPDG